jgi:diacylglycerol O-acyltransferase
MDHMSPLDAAFLDIEDAEPDSSLAIASISIFEGPSPALEDVTALVNAALPRTARYRQVVRHVPLDLGMPRWVDDPAFDISHHVRHTALPAPGGDAELRHLMSRVMAQRLSRDRPLWQVWLVEGLANGRWALINKAHHCMVDGIAGVGLLREMLSEVPDGQPCPSADEWHPSEVPRDRDLLLGAVRDLAYEPVQWGSAIGRAIGRVGRHPRATGSRLWDTSRGLLALSTTAIPAHSTSLFGPAGRARRYRLTRMSLADIAAVRAAFGGTVNDVVLSVIAGGFRALLISRGERCDPRSVRSLVPVSVRTRDTSGNLDNEVSAMLPYLPVETADAVERLHVMRDRMARLKASKEAVAGETLVQLANASPPPLIALAVRTAFLTPQRSVGTVTTNVPGPTKTLYALGRPLLEIYPYVPIASTLRLGIALLSYCGVVTCGVTCDFDSTSDVDMFVKGIDQSLHALVQAAESLESEPAGG